MDVRQKQQRCLVIRRFSVFAHVISAVRLLLLALTVEELKISKQTKKHMKNTKTTSTLLIIVALLVTTSFQTAFAQTKTNFTNQVSKTDTPNDLRSEINRFQQQRSSILLNDSTVDVGNIDFAKQFPKNDAGTTKKSWARRNWWIFPVLAGVGVGIYFLAKNSSSSGIRCNDGTISNAQNTQGACSYHGGIAR